MLKITIESTEGMAKFIAQNDERLGTMLFSHTPLSKIEISFPVQASQADIPAALRAIADSLEGMSQGDRPLLTFPNCPVTPNYAALVEDSVTHDSSAE
jgi:hypothetical protein